MNFTLLPLAESALQSLGVKSENPIIKTPNIAGYHVFYSPVYERVVGNPALCSTLWHILDTPDTVKDLYLSPVALFEKESKAQGCFKVLISQRDLGKLQLQQRVHGSDAAVHTTYIPISTQSIESFLTRTQENFPNPKKNQGSELASPTCF